MDPQGSALIIPKVRPPHLLDLLHRIKACGGGCWTATTSSWEFQREIKRPFDSAAPPQACSDRRLSAKSVLTKLR